MISIRYVQNENKPFWFKLDSHLSEIEFEKKIRDKRGYILLEDQKPIGLLINIPRYEQPMEMFLTKGV